MSGNYPNPTVVGLQSYPISTNSPTNLDVLEWNGINYTPAVLIYTLNNSNYTSINVPSNNYVNFQGAITLAANYSGLYGSNLIINGGTINGNGSYVLSAGNYCTFNGVTFNSVDINCYWGTFINCTFNGTC